MRAVVDRVGASSTKDAARRRSDGVRNVALQHDTLLAVGRVRVRDRRQQRLRVGMLRVRADGRGRSDLHHPAEVHDRDAVRDVLHHRDVVGDEEQREAEPALEILQQVDDLGLDGHVQGRDRLVRHDELGRHRQRAGEADALALPPGQGLGPPLEMVGGHRDHVEQLDHAFPALGGVVAQSLDAQRLAQDLLHRHVRIERSVRILEHDLRLAPEPAQRLRAESRHVLAAEAYGSMGRLDEPQQRAPDRGLAGAGLPGDAEHLVRVDGERHVVDRLHVGHRPRDEPAHDREPLAQSLHLDERSFGTHWSRASEMARQRQHRTR